MATVDLSRRPRTKLAFSDADMVRLRDLYYDPDVPMIRVAQAFGVSASTLYHWIAEMDWPRRSTQFVIRTHPPAHSAKPSATHSAMDSAMHSGESAPSAVVPADGCATSDAPAGHTVLDTSFAKMVADAARQELGGLHAEPAAGGGGAPGGFAQQRRADTIEKLSRAIARLDRVSDARDAARTLEARIAALETALAARDREVSTLARKLRRTERELADALAEAVARIATPAPAPQPTPVRPGQVTRPEYQQWWIDRGEEPP